MLKTFVDWIFSLVFGSCLICGSYSLPVTSITTQHHFTLDQFLGQWFEVAVVSTCPHFMQRKTTNSAIVKLNLQHTQSNVTVRATSRNDSCKTSLSSYSLTDTPGKLFYHVSSSTFRADVLVHVVDTDYVSFAHMVLVSSEPEGNQTLIVKLYSRSSDVSENMMQNFKTLVRKHGIDEEKIITNQDKGQCS